LGSESETCVGSRVHLVGVSISFEKNFYRLPFTPPISGSPYRSFNPHDRRHHDRLLAVADLPLGGLGLPTNTGYVRTSTKLLL
jgi:hypothetical protein